MGYKVEAGETQEQRIDADRISGRQGANQLRNRSIDGFISSGHNMEDILAYQWPMLCETRQIETGALVCPREDDSAEEKGGTGYGYNQSGRSKHPDAMYKPEGRTPRRMR